MKENSSQQLHMLRYTLTEQLIHGMEVSNLAYDLARELGYEKEICYELAKAGVLHDIGKIVLENYVEEQDTLVVEEMRFVRTHSTLGYELLQGRGYSDFVLESILYHHENANGSGPFGKTWEEIPLFSRIIHLSDLLDRAYGAKGFTEDIFNKACGYLHKNEGTVVDKECVDAFLQAFSLPHFLTLGEDSFEKKLWEKIPRIKQELSFAQIKELASFFAQIVDYKSPFTSTHSIGVAEDAKRLSRYMGFDEETVEKMYLAGALHDIGKVAVGNEILEKPGRLTEDEFAVMKHHAAYTYYILSDIDDFDEIRDWAAFHHERLDGTGYPFGKTAAELNTQERMMACIDIYQALTESRPYKQGMSHEKACEILWDMAKKGWLDETIVKQVEDCFRG